MPDNSNDNNVTVTIQLSKGEVRDIVKYLGSARKLWDKHNTIESHLEDKQCNKLIVKLDMTIE